MSRGGEHLAAGHSGCSLLQGPEGWAGDRRAARIVGGSPAALITAVAEGIRRPTAFSHEEAPIADSARCGEDFVASRGAPITQIGAYRSGTARVVRVMVGSLTVRDLQGDQASPTDSSVSQRVRHGRLALQGGALRPGLLEW